jgi:hypothetical protein
MWNIAAGYNDIIFATAKAVNMAVFKNSINELSGSVTYSTDCRRKSKSPLGNIFREKQYMHKLNYKRETPVGLQKK